VIFKHKINKMEYANVKLIMDLSRCIRMDQVLYKNMYADAY